jgi:hypothetical protein
MSNSPWLVPACFLQDFWQPASRAMLIGPRAAFLSAPTFGPGTGRFTLAARKDTLPNRDREGVDACLVPASPA